MPDLVERLRRGEPCQPHDDVCRIIEARSGCICAEAADEIERLRSQLYHATVAVDGIREHALEEAAQMCEINRDHYPPWIAAAIRALKEQDK